MTRRILHSDLQWLRYSLVLVWLGTALISAWEWDGQSVALLRDAGLQSRWWMETLIAAGTVTDLVLGLLLWLHPDRLVYLAALSAMALMTFVASVLLPTLWLHPLGPLLKNLPMAAVLWLLWKTSK